MGASAALFLATVLITPLGSAGRRALVAAAALAGLIVLMGLVMAGMALRPMLELGLLSSRVTWHLAALAHNATSSGLMITFPAALWFLLTLLWWRQDLARVARRNRFGPGAKSGKGGKKGKAGRRDGKDGARRKRR
jgi:hypothetical protein